MPGSFPRAIHKGFKTCPVQKAAARKEETLGSMSVKSAVNAGKVNWPTVSAWDKISPKWPLNKENVLLTLISWHRSILCSREITKKQSLSTATLRIKPNFLTSFFPGTGGFCMVEFENLLRRIDCRVTIPYWNWSKKTHHWWRGSGNEDLWNSGDHGLGGDGSVHSENCVENGPFSKDKWRLLVRRRVFKKEVLETKY